MPELAKQPCETCKHCEKKQGIAGGLYCKKEKVIASIARKGADKDRIDCWEGEND